MRSLFEKMAKTERSFVFSTTTIFLMLTSAVLASLFLLASGKSWNQGRFIEPITDCSQLPLYNNDTKIAGPWTIKIDSCYNGAGAQGLCSVEGFESSSDITRQRDDRPNTIEHGFVSSYPWYRCIHGWTKSTHEHIQTLIQKTKMINRDSDHDRKRQQQHENPTPLQRHPKNNRSIRSIWSRHRRLGLARCRNRPPPQHGATGLGKTRCSTCTGIQTLPSWCTRRRSLPRIQQ